MIAALLGASFLFMAPAAASTVADEQYALDAITASGPLQDSTRINAESHYASTPGDYHIAQWMRESLAAAGFNATIEPFTADVPFAKRIGLVMLNGKHPTKFVLGEQPIEEDPDGTRPDAGPPFNAFSGSGEIGANVIDAGHGLDADYAALAARHLDVRTRIALIRYGRQFRGTLARRAQNHGARAVIFFSDPADYDGSLRGPAYPQGPYRPMGSLQRGALGNNNVTIPTLPITALNAQRLIDDMHDGITQHPVRLTVQMVMKHNAQLWNTIGILPGKDPTHMVVLGGHRDAWVYGVTDNGSGISTLLEAARGIGALYKTGWRPQYSIVIAGFDGEEIGEVGSQAYLRMHRAALESGCIAYLNEDEATTGQIFGAMSAASLEDLVPAIVRGVRDPSQQTSGSLYYRWQRQSGGVRIEGPAGGSDFEPFLYEAGIPVMQFDFGGIFGVYHSGFDDLRYATTEADPQFANHRAIAQLAALTALRLASGTVGYHFAPYVPRMREALANIGARAGDISPVRAAIDRFATRAARADARGGDGNAQLLVVHRLNRLFYGRNGYAPVPFPDLSTAIASGDGAAISAAAGRTAHELDDIGSALANATR